MTKSVTVYYAAEEAHMHALRAARRAIRGGDIVLAERWIKLSERHWRCCDLAYLAYEDRIIRRRSRLPSRPLRPMSTPPK